MERKKRTGIYLTTKVILDNPDYVGALVDGLGLNLVILGFSGRLPEHVLAESPYDGVPLSDECLHRIVARYMDGEPCEPREFDQVRGSVGPSMGGGGSDDDFRKAVDIAREAGCEVWICGGSWTLSRFMFCPSNEAVNNWYEALYVYLATNAGVDGLDLTHARYPMVSYPEGLLACACENCSQRAVELGYDMAAMRTSVSVALERLGKADPARLVSSCAGGMGPLDFLQFFDSDSGITDWFNFRAELIGRNLKRFREAVHAAAGEDFIFGSDNHPASLSMLVGHNHARWDDFSDFASPLVSHVYQFVSLALIELARLLRGVLPTLTETDALQIVYAATGYGGIGLPETEAAFNAHDPEALAHSIPLKEIILHDLVKARLSLPEAIPSYPIIHGEGWPREAILAIRDGAFEAGHDGIMWQGTSELVEFDLK